MKTLFCASVVWILLASSVALACSIYSGLDIDYPSYGLTGVPVNAPIIIDDTYCDGCFDSAVVQLVDVERDTEIALVADENTVGVYRPVQTLRSDNDYLVSLHYNHYGTSKESSVPFTTGSAVDEHAPDLSDVTVEVVVDYAAHHEEAYMFIGGMCSPEEVDVSDVEEYSYTILEDELLPAHYSVHLQVSGVQDVSKHVQLTLSEILADGSVVEHDQTSWRHQGFYLSLPRLLEDEAAEAREYRVTAQDVFGHVQSQQIALTMELAQESITYNANTTLVGESITVPGGGDGESGGSGAGGGSGSGSGGSAGGGTTEPIVSGGCSLILR